MPVQGKADFTTAIRLMNNASHAEQNWMSTLFDGIIIITITYSYSCQGNKQRNI